MTNFLSSLTRSSTLLIGWWKILYGNSGFTVSVVPVVILIFLSIGLVRKLVQIEEKRSKIQSAPVRRGSNANSFDHTNHCLATIVIWYVISEFPAVMLYTAGAMMGKDFLKHVSQKIVFVTDLLQITVGTIMMPEMIVCKMLGYAWIIVSRLLLPEADLSLGL